MQAVVIKCLQINGKDEPRRGNGSATDKVKAGDVLLQMSFFSPLTRRRSV